MKEKNCPTAADALHTEESDVRYLTASYIVSLLSTTPEAQRYTVTSVTQDDKQKVVIYYRELKCSVPFKQSCDLERPRKGLLLPLTFNNSFLTKRVLVGRKKKHLKQIFFSPSRKPIGTHFSIFIYSMFLIQNPQVSSHYP